MSDTMMLCSNCGRYHCCNFRPASSASTMLTPLKETTSTVTTRLSPDHSRATATNEYQIGGRIAPVQNAKVTSRLHSPKRVEMVRPKSSNTQFEANGRHYLFKKHSEKPAREVIRQKPVLQRRASPMRVNVSRGGISSSPARVVAGTPIRSSDSRIGSSPPRISYLASNPPARVVSQSPQKGSIVSTPQHNTAYTVSQTAVSKSPIFPKQRPTQLKTTTVPIRNSPPPTSTTVFPRPANVMVPQAISKLDNSKTTMDDYRHSKVSFPSENNHECAYKDNRCFGFDFLKEQQQELRLDNKGHIKEYLHS